MLQNTSRESEKNLFDRHCLILKTFLKTFQTAKNGAEGKRTVIVEERRDKRMMSWKRGRGRLKKL